VDELRAALPFRDLDDAHLARLAELGRIRTAETGEVLARPGDQPDGLYVVLSGGVRMSRPMADGGTIDLGERRPGDSFGEAYLLNPAPRWALVTVTEPTRFFVLGRPAFLAFMEEAPEAMSDLLAGIGSQLRVTQERLIAETAKEHALQVQVHAGRYRSLAQLVAGVAHEINTPLGIITTAASVLAQDLTDLVCDAGPITGPLQEAIEAASLISSNLARATRLVERFKSLSTSQAVTVVDDVDLTDVVDDVLALFAPKARAAGLAIEVVDERDDPKQRWTGDAGCLAEALLNLLSNVERYAYPPGAGGRAEVVLDSDEGHFDVIVRDFGRGIPPEHLDQVWEPFFTTGRSMGGTGLGLAVVNSLVADGMFGSAEIHSEPGAGTSVHLRFPRTLPERQDAGS
jgi:signal transduction histidine kinase